MSARRALLARIAEELGHDPRLVDGVPDPAHPVPLPSRLATGDLAWATVAAASLAAEPRAPHRAAPDPDRIALSYRSDRLLQIDAEAPPIWSPFSGFWRTVDGWVRTHGNYAHHAHALKSALRLGDDAGADEVRDALARRTVRDTVDRITRAGGLAVAVAPEDPAHDAALRRRPLVDITRLAASAPAARRTAPSADAPLGGIRVLDLTRVIAGPVCTRTLALLGADVLRIDPPHLPEPEWQHLDTGHGKRSALLDARSDRMEALIADADVVVLGYRPAALDRLGLSPARLAARNPRLIIAQLSAWGADHPDRAGFDSLVQAASGIALIEAAGPDRPGALPAQALDHSAGYLLAAAVCALVDRRAREGGAWCARTSLRRIAAELLGMPRRDEPAAETSIDREQHRQEFVVGGRSLVTARAAIPGFSFRPPRPWGRDEPAW